MEIDLSKVVERARPRAGAFNFAPNKWRQLEYTVPDGRRIIAYFHVSLPTATKAMALESLMQLVQAEEGDGHGIS